MKNRTNSLLFTQLMKIKAFLLLLPAFILFNCQNCGETPGSTFSENTVIKMEKTACFGACPMFSIEINGKGVAAYNGVKYVDKIGDHQKTFDLSVSDPVFQAFADANFWAFDDEYTANVTDLPTTFLEFKHDGQEKKIRMYYNVPQELRDLEKLVDDLANSSNWNAL